MSHLIDIVYCQFSPPPPCTLFPFAQAINHPLCLLENPPLVLVGRMFVHTRSWLVINCPPPTANSPPLSSQRSPTVHFTCFQRWHHNIRYIVWYTIFTRKQTEKNYGDFHQRWLGQSFFWCSEEHFLYSIFLYSIWNRTRNKAVHTWRFSLLSYGRHPAGSTLFRLIVA